MISDFMLSDIACREVPPNLGPTLTLACEEFDIRRPMEQAAFLAQACVESAGFSRVEESLIYTRAERILSVFPRAFETLAEARAYIRNPLALASRAYAGILGNGSIASGDGWRYRGRGFKQITGRDNYRACMQDLYGDPDTDPNRLLELDGAARSAAWFWLRNQCGQVLMTRGFDAVTRVVNGPAMLGKDERRAAFARARAALGIEAAA